jgi:hypothetical protein
LAQRRPADVNAAAWDEATAWANTAYANVFFSEQHTPIDELRRFRIDVEERLEGDVDLATIDWLWQRLGETGPHGRRYRHRFEPQYRESLKELMAKGLE